MRNRVFFVVAFFFFLFCCFSSLFFRGNFDEAIQHAGGPKTTTTTPTKNYYIINTRNRVSKTISIFSRCFFFLFFCSSASAVRSKNKRCTARFLFVPVLKLYTLFRQCCAKITYLNYPDKTTDKWLNICPQTYYIRQWKTSKFVYLDNRKMKPLLSR